ncbi:lipid-A-disaccharide synthase [gamma proteobacterium HTCC2207]|uniref:Lipid-A-disaccharide synthase n=1 Tax=gamma proteobacterium HTCC2207 TaxID=314287 RepID=Q1YTW0_9GAMM|nr:lipid-A-disaccharide synthase [gamma proteobacterium HTCC2207]
MSGLPDNPNADMNTPTFAMVAGEASGDTLGADLIRALRRLFPDARFEGIGGPKMIAEGFVSFYQMDRLSVMGFVEPFKRLPELLSIRRDIINRCKLSKPAAFIGIDSPDFNLGIEKALHKSGIKTVHYVSPSVWAWRQGRIKGIKRSVDLMLTLLPFEEAFYQQHLVPVAFVGHPLAGQISRTPDSSAARQQLGLDINRPLLTLMPGSRSGEIALMGTLFLMVATDLLKSNPQLQFLIPAANGDRHRQLTEILAGYPKLPVTLIKQQSLLAMEAADAVLLASGTTALEAMLLKKPMVVSYKLGKWTYKLVKPFIKTPFASIPNLLATEMLVPELIQDDATVETLSSAVSKALDPKARDSVEQRFEELYEQINLPSGDTAAVAINKLISS